MKSGMIFLQKVSDLKIGQSRSLRKEMTRAETILWESLRNRKLDGYKFRRQQIIKGYIADFFCEESKLIVEVDGAIHQTDEHKEYDMHRDATCKLFGLTTLRIPNELVLNDLPSALKCIRDFCKTQNPGSPLLAAYLYS
jgi:very-short-patch-repair endonuclease